MQAVRLGERDLLDDRRRIEALQGEERVAERQPVGDDEDQPLRAREDEPETADVARRHLGPALAAGRGLRRVACPGPPAVLVERLALELAEADVVQLGHDEPGHVPSGQGEVGRLAHTEELARHAELDRLVRE